MCSFPSSCFPTTAGPLHANLRAPRRIDGVLSGALNLPLAGFVITLKPGRYTLTVSYKQKLFVEARRHGYFRHWPEKDVTGIDYLLYPIWSWPTADTFRFTVERGSPTSIKKRSLPTAGRGPVHFQRHSEGRVDSFILPTGRVKNIQFIKKATHTKQPAAEEMLRRQRPPRR